MELHFLHFLLNEGKWPAGGVRAAEMYLDNCFCSSVRPSPCVKMPQKHLQQFRFRWNSDNGGGHRVITNGERGCSPGCLGARLGLPLVGSLLCWPLGVCWSWSWVSFSSRWSRSLSSVVSSVCVAWERSNSPFRPSVSSSCSAYEEVVKKTITGSAFNYH